MVGKGNMYPNGEAANMAINNQYNILSWLRREQEEFFQIKMELIMH